MEPRNPDEQAVERTLASFAPRATRLDRDRLMFLAGQASAGAAPAQGSKLSVPTHAKTSWHWPAATAALAALSLALALMLVVQASRNPVAIVSPPETNPAPQSTVAAELQPESAAERLPPETFVDVRPASISTSSLLSMRNVALAHGIDALPQSPSRSGASADETKPAATLVRPRDKASIFGGRLPLDETL